MTLTALILGITGTTLALTAWIALIWIARKANDIAALIEPVARGGPGQIKAASAADTVFALAGDPAVVADAGDRTVNGLIVPYGTPGDTSAGSFAVEPGAFELPTDLSRVKLLRGHDRDAPVGYLAAVREDERGLWGTFAIAPGQDGDDCLAAVRARTRDGLSYEVSRVEYSADRARLTSARLDAVALCSVPAYDDARAVAASRMEIDSMFTLDTARAIVADASSDPASRAGAAAFIAASPDATDADRAAAALAVEPVATETDTDAPNLAAVVAGRPAGISHYGARPSAAVSAEQGVERLAAALRGAVDAGQINAALADVIPANDAGAGGLRAQWIGELWTAVNPNRPFIDSINRARLTTGLKVHGWTWGTTPEVGPYAGNKTDIPTNAVSTVPAESPVRRTAGGWDIDRIFFDQGDAGFLDAFLRRASIDYAQKTEAAVVADLIAGSTAATADSLLAALGVIAGELSAIGASPSFIGVSSDLWAEYLAITSADAPWWLSKQSTVALSGGSTNVADLRVFASPGLPAGTVLGGDRNAATYYEASPSPVKVQAVNVPKGGIDIGLYGYDAIIVNDPRALIATAVTVIP